MRGALATALTGIGVSGILLAAGIARVGCHRAGELWGLSCAIAVPGCLIVLPEYAFFTILYLMPKKQENTEQGNKGTEH